MDRIVRWRVTRLIKARLRAGRKIPLHLYVYALHEGIDISEIKRNL